MTTNRTRNSGRSIRRALLLASGPNAQAIGERAQALSQSWLAVEPPLRLVCIPPTALAGEGDRTTDAVDTRILEALERACDQLASAALAERLREQGLGLACLEEIQAWLVIDVDTTAGPSDQGTVAAAHLLEALDTLTWRRLRVQIVPHILLLAEADAQEQVSAWASNLEAIAAERICIASPVNRDHLRLSQTDWQERAAIGLAALLWGAFPGHQAASDQPGGDGRWIWALGGAAWPSTLATLKRWLALQRAREATRLLHGAAARGDEGNPSQVVVSESMTPGAGDGSPAPAPDRSDHKPLWVTDEALLVSPERHRQEMAICVPPAPEGEVWRDWRPSWPSLANLTATLRQHNEQRITRHRPHACEARLQCLAEHLDTWQTGLQRLREQRLRPANGWPQLGTYCLDLESLGQHLQQACGTVEDWLEQATGRFNQAQGAVDEASSALEVLGQGFPPPTVAGIVTVVTQPWRWPAWAWTYLVRLPERGQKLLDAFHRQSLASQQEANIHTLRQVHLAMAQDVRQCLDRATELAEVLTETETLLEQMEEQEVDWTELAPWSRERLQRLVTTLPADPDEDIISLLWQDGGPAAEFASRILAWAEAAGDGLDGLSALDCLAMALPDDALDRWMDAFVQQALPLWPGQEMTPQPQAETWLLCPAFARDGSQSHQVTPLERVRAWGQGQPQLKWGESHIDAVLALRWQAVNLELEKPGDHA